MADTLFAIGEESVFYTDTNPANSGNFDFAASNLPIPVVDFDYDAAADQHAAWKIFMPEFRTTTDITVTMHIFTSVSDGSAGFEIQFMKLSAGDDLDDETFATVQATSVADFGVLGDPNHIHTVTKTFTNAEADTIAGGDWFILKVNHDDGVADAMSGIVHVLGISGKQA